MNDLTIPDDITKECQHHSVDIRALRCVNETIQYVKQCLLCGAKVGSPMKKDDVIRARGPLDMISPFDQEARERGRSDIIQARRQTLIAQKQQDRDNFHSWYAKYLQSTEWKDKRSKVMRRAGGLCEGCLESRAVVVHHTSYGHVGNELLFELVALCNPCHELAHSDRRFNSLEHGN